MAFVQTLVAGIAGRRAARGLGRYIPNPVLRFITVTAVTALVPLAVKRISERRKKR